MPAILPQFLGVMYIMRMQAGIPCHPAHAFALNIHVLPHKRMHACHVLLGPAVSGVMKE
jgi:hypothetical protein